MESPKYIPNHIISLNNLNTDDVKRECYLFTQQMHTIAEKVAHSFFEQGGAQCREEAVLSRCDFPLILQEIETTILQFKQTFTPETWQILMNSKVIRKGTVVQFSELFIPEIILNNLLLSVYNISQGYYDDQEKHATPIFLHKVDKYYIGMSLSLVHSLVETWRLAQYKQQHPQEAQTLFRRVINRIIRRRTK